MNLSPQRKRLLVILAAIALALGVGLAWFLSSEGTSQVRIVLLAGPQTNAPITRVLHGPKGDGFVVDDLRQKFPPGSRICFQLVSDKDIALAVWATGVEVRTPDGWMIANEE